MGLHQETRVETNALKERFSKQNEQNPVTWVPKRLAHPNQMDETRQNHGPWDPFNGGVGVWSMAHPEKPNF